MSLPTRERGLKLAGNGKRRRNKKSLPTRERGLKRDYDEIYSEVDGRSLRGSVD